MRRGLFVFRPCIFVISAMESTSNTHRAHAGIATPRASMKLVVLLALATLVFFGGGGALLVVYVQHRALLPLICGTPTIWWQVLVGTVSGLAIGYGAWLIISRSFMRDVLLKYAMLIGPLMPSRAIRVLISMCAGVGEEVFFRGAIQHWLGIVWTAIAFVALHGYLDPRSWRLSLYGVFLTLAMIGIGWHAREYGLLAPMIAHTLIDVVLLNKVCSVWKRTVPVA